VIRELVYLGCAFLLLWIAFKMGQAVEMVRQFDERRKLSS
jgi:hypothetical protein